MPTPPSVHVRALLTWLAIFPMVAVGMVVVSPLMDGLPAVVVAFVLTIVIVPLAVYIIVPAELRVYRALRRRTASRTPPTGTPRL